MSSPTLGTLQHIFLGDSASQVGPWDVGVTAGLGLGVLPLCVPSLKRRLSLYRTLRLEVSDGRSVAIEGRRRARAHLPPDEAVIGIRLYVGRNNRRAQST